VLVHWLPSRFHAVVKRVYGIVGDSLNGLTDAIRRQGKIEWVHIRHEEVAAFAGRHRDDHTRDPEEPIEMPRNSPTGFVTAFFAVVTGFALIWHIWWMAILGAFGAFVTLLVFAFRKEEEFEISSERIAQFDRAHRAEGIL
jgi:hypothetical protein